MPDRETHARAARQLIDASDAKWKARYTPEQFAAFAQVEALLAIAAAIAGQQPQANADNAAAAASIATQNPWGQQER